MTDRGGGSAAERLWTAFEARDWDRAADQLDEDFVAQWPHSRERIRGRANYIELNRNYPEGWSIQILNALAAGDVAALEARVVSGNVTEYVACFYQLREGRIVRGTEYWITEGYQEAPQWRAHWTEPL